MTHFRTESIRSKTSEIRQGVKVLFGAFIGIMFSGSVLFFYTFGIFLGPISNDLGWNRATVSIAPTVMTVGAVLLSPFMGHIADRYGTRHTVVASLPFTAAGYFMLSRISSDNLSFFILSMIIMAVAGVGTSHVVFARVAALNFVRSRGLALGIILTGTGVTGVVAPPIVGYLVAMEGWRDAYGAIAIVYLVALPFLFLLLPSDGSNYRDDSSTTKSAPTQDAREEGLDFKSAVRTRAFWVLASTMVFIGVPITGFLIHFVPILIDTGVDPMRAASLASVLGISVIAGRLSTGFLLDHIFAPYLVSFIFLCASIGCVTLALFGPAFAIPAAFLVAFASGAEFDAIGYMVARYFGKNAFGTIYGTLFTVFQVGASLGSVLVAFTYDITGQYDIAIYLGSLLIFLSAVVVLTLKRYTW